MDDPERTRLLPRLPAPVAKELVERWAERRRAASSASEPAKHRMRRAWDNILALVGGVQRAGGIVLAGTDCPNVAIVSGFSLHRELELLVRAGLSPMEAIVAATRRPAERLGKQDVFGTIAAGIFGWLAPVFVVDRKARKRRDQIEKSLPDLIDLVVVTLEAGLSFPQSLRLASTKIKEPLAGEVRLTLQEQNMGLTLVEALMNFLGRIDTAGVRMFARSIAQGETMGVSTGQIMRNLAVELRKRRRAAAEEQAQKAPVKMLFPIAFLIMPALFIVLLVPMVIIIMDVL